MSVSQVNTGLGIDAAVRLPWEQNLTFNLPELLRYTFVTPEHLHDGTPACLHCGSPKHCICSFEGSDPNYRMVLKVGSGITCYYLMLAFEHDIIHTVIHW